jgi:O-antigen ligase
VAVAAAAVVVAASVGRRLRVRVSLSAPLALGAALLAWTVVIAPSAVDRGLAAKQVTVLAAGLLFALAVLAASGTTGDARRVGWAVVLVATAISIVAIVFEPELESESGGSIVRGRPTGTLAQPNELGTLCAFAAPLGTALLSSARTSLVRAIALVATVAVLTGLALSASRAAWMGATVAFAYLVIAVPRAWKAVPIVAVAFAATLFVLSHASSQFARNLGVVGERSQAIGQRSPEDFRAPIWREALREIREDPIAGSGPGGYPVASRRATDRALREQGGASHAHNIVLTWGAEGGIPGAALVVAFILAVALVVRRARTAPEPADLALIGGTAAALVAILVQGALDYTLRNAVLFYAMWALIGILLVCDRERRTRRVSYAPSSSQISRVGLPVGR